MEYDLLSKEETTLSLKQNTLLNKEEATLSCYRNRLKNSIQQLKGKILESIAPEEFHLVEKIHENSYKKFFELTEKRHMPKFHELISKNKVTQGSATNTTDEKKWVINVSSRQLTQIETNILVTGLNFSIIS